MGKIIPCNRHILISPLESEEEEEELIVPEQFRQVQTTKPQYTKWKVEETSQDITVEVSMRIKKGDIVLVEDNMVKIIEDGDDTKFLILENYVLWAEKE